MKLYFIYYAWHNCESSFKVKWLGNWESTQKTLFPIHSKNKKTFSLVVDVASLVLLITSSGQDGAIINTHSITHIVWSCHMEKYPNQIPFDIVTVHRRSNLLYVGLMQNQILPVMYWKVPGEGGDMSDLESDKLDLCSPGEVRVRKVRQERFVTTCVGLRTMVRTVHHVLRGLINY